MKFYDNSRIKDYRTCPRYYYYRHIRGWTKPAGPALSAGLGWHAGQDFIWANIKGADARDLAEVATEIWIQTMNESGIDVESTTYVMNEPKRTAGVFKEMFLNYIQQRRAFIEEVDIISIERPFAVPLGLSTKVFYIGRVDKEFRRDGRVIVLDHKTTSAYAKNGPFRQSFLESFSPDSQIDGYSYAAYIQYGKEFKAVYVDAALVHKTVHDGFKLIPVERAYNSLDNWLYDTERWVNLIEQDKLLLSHCKDTDPFLKAFSKKAPESCIQYNHPCIYKDICRFHDNPMQLEEPPEGFVEDHWNPFEVNRIAELGFEDED